MFKKITTNKNKLLLSFMSFAALSFPLAQSANATIVIFETSQGDVKVNLFDELTPKTVTNFLDYVKAGHYTDTVIHRAQSDFIVQGGGYEFTGEWPLTSLISNASITNEPFYSNIAGTIAMAKISTDRDSATDQWFFNVGDNSENLDLQNDGFTVFGQIVGDGMDTISKISKLELCQYNSTFNQVPMIIDPGQSCTDMAVPGHDDFVILKQIIIYEDDESTLGTFKPTVTTEPDSDGDGVKDENDYYPNDPTKDENPNADDDSAGSTNFFALIALGLFAIRKRLTSRLRKR